MLRVEGREEVEAEVKNLVFDVDSDDIAEFTIKFLKTDRIAKYYAPIASFCYGFTFTLVLLVILATLRFLPFVLYFYTLLGLNVLGGLIAVATGLINHVVRLKVIVFPKIGIGRRKIDRMLGPMEVTLGSTDIVCKSKHKSTSVAYKKIDRIEEDEKRAYVFLSRKTGLVFKRESVRVGNCERFLDELEMRMASAKASSKPA